MTGSYYINFNDQTFSLQKKIIQINNILQEALLKQSVSPFFTSNLIKGKNVPTPRHKIGIFCINSKNTYQKITHKKKESNSLILIVFSKYKQKIVQQPVFYYLLQKTCIDDHLIYQIKQAKSNHKNTECFLNICDYILQTFFNRLSTKYLHTFTVFFKNLFLQEL